MNKMNDKTKQNVFTGVSSTAGAVAGVAVGSMVAGQAQAAEVSEQPIVEENEPVDETSQHYSAGTHENHHQKPSPQPRPDDPEPKPDDPAPKPEPSDEVEVLDYTSDENGDLAVVRVDGETYYVLDVDQDGSADYIASDQNHDGSLQDNEIHDVQGQGISMQPFKEGHEGGSKPADNQNGGGHGNSDVEVVSYETVTNEDGSQMDVAVVSQGDQQVMLVDMDQNGYADYAAADANGNGQLESNEIVDVSGQNIEMQPLQAAANGSMAPAGTDPVADDSYYVQTDDVDYVNDANVDSFMA